MGSFNRKRAVTIHKALRVLLAAVCWYCWEDSQEVLPLPPDIRSEELGALLPSAPSTPAGKAALQPSSLAETNQAPMTAIYNSSMIEGTKNELKKKKTH